jgi:hypothetical protein
MPPSSLEFFVGIFPAAPHDSFPYFVQAAAQAAPRRGEGRGEPGRGGVLAGLRRARGPRRVAFLSSA